MKPITEGTTVRRGGTFHAEEGGQDPSLAGPIASASEEQATASAPAGAHGGSTELAEVRAPLQKHGVSKPENTDLTEKES
ncbi:MAG: hypothetical protein AABZ64_10565 [Nitrospinota bacterium]